MNQRYYIAAPPIAMKIIVWNFRGLGNHLTFQTLHKILIGWGLRLYFLCETKGVVTKLESDCRKLRYNCCLVVGRSNSGGGLALMCWHELDVNVRSYSLHYTDIVIKKNKELSWWFIGIYGHLETGMKRHTYELLYCLNSSFYLLWVCEGDFNKVLELNEKIGGRVRCLDAIADFW